MIRGTGFLPDPPTFKRAPMHEIVGAYRVGMANRMDYRDSGVIDAVRDQGYVNACVAFARNEAIHFRARLLGFRPRFCSALAVYYWARSMDASRPEHIVDLGCRPSSAALAARRWGLPSEDAWPFDPRNVGIAPPMDVELAASEHIPDGEYEITAIGRQRSVEIARALAAGHFPCFAIAIDSTFEQADGTTLLPPPSEDIKGYHMIVAVGYRPNAYGGNDILILNSWGTTWGDSGFAWLSPERIGHPTTSSVQVITSVIAHE